MVKQEEDSSMSEAESSGNSSSDDQKIPYKDVKQEAKEYEKQREARIAANKARMQALGLHSMANSLMGPPQTPAKTSSTPKSKRVVRKLEKDDEYQPHDDDDDCDHDGGLSSSSDEDFEEEMIVRKGKKSCSRKDKNIKLKSGKKMTTAKDIPDVMDEDEALKQAIALSLKDSGGSSDLQLGRSLQTRNATIDENNHDHFQENNTRRKKRKSFSSRVQMTEDDLVINFCQIDEVGKGSITLRDVERMAATHDFTWTDKELFDMIHCFDHDRDGKLTMDDFRNIALRCNMLLGSEES